MLVFVLSELLPGACIFVSKFLFQVVQILESIPPNNTSTTAMMV